MTTDARPADLGYRWPAEWEPHEATWIAWPHNRETWPGKFEKIPPLFAQLVRTLAEFEPVNILASGTDVMADAKSLVGHMGNVTLFDIETNDAWTRDHGPTFLQSSDSPPALIDWQYNAWGRKYPPWDKDNAVGRTIADQIGMRRFSPGLVLEGGAIEGNGAGTLLTTTSCLLNPNRNPTMNRQIVEQYLAAYLGASNIIWLDGRSIAGDDTDGHIDQLARFVDPKTIVCAVSNDPNDEQHGPMQANLDRLRSLRDDRGSALEVVLLPLPEPLHYDGQRLPASYCNFYIANGVVIVPLFNDPADESALSVLAEVFPDRRVVGIQAVDVVWGLGAFHCLTQQQPHALG